MTTDSVDSESVADSLSSVSDRVADEHDRLAIYRRAIRHPELDDPLLSALSREPEPLILSSVLAEIFENRPDLPRNRLLDLMPATQRGWLQRRADEWTMIEALESERSADADVIALLADGSDWLQRQLARASINSGVLAELATQGRTKSVRHEARRRLALLRNASPGNGAEIEFRS